MKRELGIGGKKTPTKSYNNNTKRDKSSENMHFKSLKHQTGCGNQISCEIIQLHLNKPAPKEVHHPQAQPL